jgi:hypothetical protein
VNRSETLLGRHDVHLTAALTERATANDSRFQIGIQLKGDIGFRLGHVIMCSTILRTTGCDIRHVINM